MKDAHVGAVKSYSIPAAPQPPTLPADLAAELSAYDAVEPVVTGQTASATHSPETLVTGADTFLAFLEADEPKAESAHH